MRSALTFYYDQYSKASYKYEIEITPLKKLYGLVLLNGLNNNNNNSQQTEEPLVVLSNNTRNANSTTVQTVDLSSQDTSIGQIRELIKQGVVKSASQTTSKNAQQ